jgi:hypothetical protein
MKGCEMSEQEAKQQGAVDFLSSIRGQLVMKQALDVAIHNMEAVSEERREVSNISDIRYIRDNVFAFPVEFDRTGAMQVLET